MKIPFDIKYRPQIESGEYKVVDGLGNDAKILSFECDDDTYPILAEVRGTKKKYTLEGRFLTCASCCSSDLVIVINQEKTSWKPSVEQMLTLYSLAYITRTIDDEKDDNLTKLYRDLKREFFNGNFNPELEIEKKNRTDFEKAVEKVVSEGFGVLTVKEQSDFLLGEAKKELEKQQVEEDEVEEEREELTYLDSLDEALLDFYDDWHINYDYSLVNDKNEGLDKWKKKITEIVQKNLWKG